MERLYIPKEVVDYGFNWFAFICALVVFLFILSLIQKSGKDLNGTEDKVFAFFIVSGSFGIATYFLINFMQ